MSIEVFPVVHVQDSYQAAAQSGLAFAAGADGVYLIDHNSVTTRSLIESFNTVSAQNPGRFVGLNFLQHYSAAQSLRFLLDSEMRGDIRVFPDGLWVDDANQEMHDAVVLRTEYPELAGIRYLGGVAFKHTAGYTSDPRQAAADATRLRESVDVVTTSGAATGMPPSPAKIAAMKAVLEDQPLAVASGISAENLPDYNESFDQLLVSTSIETEPYSGIFVKAKIRELVAAAHAA